MKPKILVIEDEKDILDNIRLFLKSEKYDVITVNNGVDGIKLAKSLKPDLVLCDIMMPGMDGYEVLSILSNDEEIGCIPFIFLTAKVEKTDLRKGMEMGADDYIFKPFTYRELIAAIKTRLAKQKRMMVKASFRKENYSDENDVRIEYDDNIMIKFHSKTIPIKAKKIVYITAENQYSRLVCENNRNFFVRKSLNSWEAILPTNYFVRIHRSNLVNIDYVEKVDANHSSAKVILKDSSDTITVSRRYLKKIRSNFLVVANAGFLAIVGILF